MSQVNCSIVGASVVYKGVKYLCCVDVDVEWLHYHVYSCAVCSSGHVTRLAPTPATAPDSATH